MSVQNVALQIKSIAQGIAEAGEKAKTDTEILQLALQILQMPVSLVSKMVASAIRVSHLIKEMKYSEIVEKFGLPIFVLTGYRSQLAKKFDEEFGKMDHLELIDKLKFATLKQLNEYGIVTDEKFEKIRADYIHNAQAKLDRLGFSKFYFEELQKMRIGEISAENYLADVEFSFEQIHSPKEMREKLLAEHPTVQKMFSAFSPEKLLVLFLEQIVTMKEMIQLQSLQKAKTLSKIAPMPLSQILDKSPSNTPIFEEGEILFLSMNPLTKKTDRDLLVYLLGQEGLEQKFYDEFTGWRRADILEAVPAFGEIPSLQALLPESAAAAG